MIIFWFCQESNMITKRFANKALGRRYLVKKESIVNPIGVHHNPIGQNSKTLYPLPELGELPYHPHTTCTTTTVISTKKINFYPIINDNIFVECPATMCQPDQLRQSRPLPPEPISCSPPACLRWAKALHHLLEDPDGVTLFREYLQAEGRPHADALDFWFACEGLRKQSEPEKIGQLIKVIYK